MVDRWLEAHVEFLDAGYREGAFLASGPKTPRTGGVILARAANREALDTLLARDPFMREGVARYTVTAFTARRTAEGVSGLIP